MGCGRQAGEVGGFVNELERQAKANLDAARERRRVANERERAFHGLEELFLERARASEHPDAVRAFEQHEAKRAYLEAREMRGVMRQKFEALEIPVLDEVLELMLTDRLTEKSRDGRTWDALTRARFWLRTPSRALVLLGDPGHGKTVAAAELALRFLQRGESVAYVKEPQLAMWSQHVSREPDVMALRRVALLIVDEIGTTPAQPFSPIATALTDMVDSRRRGALRTVLCGNVPNMDGISRRYGSRLSDRLRECGQIHEFTGPSKRRSTAS